MGAVVFYQLPGQGEIEIKYGQEKSKEVNKINDPAKTVHSPAIVNNGTIKKPFDITDEKIGNQKVLIWAPYESVFKTDMRTSLEPIINNANVKLQLTVQADNSCTVSSFQKITDYGLIIIDSHGSEGKYILTNEKYNSSNYLTYRGWINNGSIEVWTEIIRDSTKTIINQYDYYVITNKFISNLGSSFPQSVIFNGSCESTKSDFLANAFLSKGAETYFGFNEAVCTPFCSAMADNIVWWLSDLYATTGEAFTPGLTDPQGDLHAEFQMIGSEEMSYMIPRWSGSFHYSKNVVKEYVDGDETRTYNINITADFELNLVNPEDTILFNPFYFMQDSISGPYEISYEKQCN